MLAHVSPWSADLLDVGADTDRVGELAHRFHVDLADGHLTPQPLFVPLMAQAGADGRL